LTFAKVIHSDVKFSEDVVYQECCIPKSFFKNQLVFLKLFKKHSEWVLSQTV